MAQKPYIIGSLGPKALKYVSFEGKGRSFFRVRPVLLVVLQLPPRGVSPPLASASPSAQETARSASRLFSALMNVICIHHVQSLNPKFLCTYTYTYIYIYIHIHICKDIEAERGESQHISVRLPIHLSTYVSLHGMSIFLSAYLPTCLPTYLSGCICIHIYIYTHTCTRTYLYIYICTHTSHSLAHSLSLSLYIYIYMCVCVYTYYVYTDMHAHVLVCLFLCEKLYEGCSGG